MPISIAPTSSDPKRKQKPGATYRGQTWQKKSVFDQIQTLLVREIPKAISQASPATPMAILRICYYDTHAPLTYLDFRCVSEAERNAIVKKKGKYVLNDLWSVVEEPGVRPNLDLPADPPTSAADKKLTQLFAQIYEILSEDEDEGMTQFRSALQSVCRQLNDIDWSAHCEVTDDFVVAPGDGSAHFDDDEPDLRLSIPAQKLATLQQRGFLGSKKSLLVRD